MRFTEIDLFGVRPQYFGFTFVLNGIGLIIFSQGAARWLRNHPGEPLFFACLVSNAIAVINAGHLKGAVGDGVDLTAGGSVANRAGGSIIGKYFGVQISGGAGKVVDAGAIKGSKGSVEFEGGGDVLRGQVPGPHPAAQLHGQREPDQVAGSEQARHLGRPVRHGSQPS